MHCACAACKKGVKIGTPPPPGVDKRPWSVVDADGNEVDVCWREDTAKALLAIRGKGHKVTKRKKRRRKVAS